MKHYHPLSIFQDGQDLPIFTGTPDTFTDEAPIVAPLPPTHDQLSLAGDMMQATIKRDHWTEGFDSYAGWVVTVTDPSEREEEPVTFADVDHDYDAYASYEAAADYAESRIFHVTEA